MDLESQIKQCLTDFDETSHEAGCTRMLQALLTLEPHPTESMNLGPFELKELIGRGGMGEVWKAHHTRLDRVFAVKRIKPQVIVNDELAQRFEREMRIAGNLDHPYIVRITHADKVDHTHYLAMEYIEGETLSLRQQKLSEQGLQFDVEEVCRLGAEIASAMQYAHEQDVVHRDLKPANVMIAEDGHVRLLDMGLARVASVEASVSELTSVNQIMGTPDYMSPEQVSDSRNATAKSDIYSLGATLYKLLVGKAPFDVEGDSTVAARIMAIASQKPASVQSQRSDVPESLSNLIGMMLAKDPEQRPASMQLVADELAAFSISTARSMPADTASDRGRGKVWGGVVAAVLVVAACVFGLQKITVKDPVYGNIRITAPDDIKVRLNRVDDPAVVREVTANDKNFRLRQGTWEIQIDGAFEGYTLEGPDRIEITDDRNRVVKVVSSASPEEPQDAGSRKTSVVASQRDILGSIREKGGLFGLDAGGAVADVKFMSPDFADEDLAFLQDCKTLRAVRVPGTSVTAKCISLLPAGVQFIDLTDTGVGDEVVTKLSDRKLTVLGLSGTLVTDDFATQLKQQETLRELSLESCNVTGKFTKALLEYRKLESLSVGSTRFDDAAVARLTGLNLRRFYLANCPITDRALESMVKMKSLTDISLGGCMRLTERGVVAIARCENIQQLQLTKVPLSVESLLQIAEFPNLARIIVSKEHKENLRQSPNFAKFGFE